MKHLKQWIALILAVMLALSLAGVAEDENVNDEAVRLFDGVLSNEVIAPEADDMPEEFDLSNLLDPSIYLADEAQDTPASEIAPETPVVTKAPAPTKAPAAVVSNEIPSKITLGVKEKYTIDTSSMSGKITYKSSKTSIATVSSKGVITAKKVGTAKITVTPKKGKKKTITVTVAKAPTKVTLDKKSLNLEVEDWWELKPTLPKKTASYKLTWSSSNKKVAAVDADGWVHAKKAGTATITVKTFNGKKATCKVTVTAPKPTATPTASPTVAPTVTPTPTPVVTPTPTPVPLSVTVTNVIVQEDNQYNLLLTYRGNGSISYSVSDSDIIGCKWDDGWYGNDTYLYITGKEPGTATITITDKDTGYSVKVNVTVMIRELLYLYGKTINTVNTFLHDKLYYEGDNSYSNAYFDVRVNSSGKIDLIFLTKGNGRYTLNWIYPGESSSSASSTLNRTGWVKYSFENGVNYFTNSALPGHVLGIESVSGSITLVAIA